MMSIASSPFAVGDGPDLAELRAIVGNPAIPVEERARRALDGSASLDQAAQQAAQASERRARWSQAVGLLDEFLSKDPQADASPLIRFQAAVYRWAEGRSFAEQAELAPAEAKLRAGAIEALDDSTRRLRSIEVKPIEAAEPFGQNVRFRLAQSIADRAKLDPNNDPGRLALEREALAMLDASLSMPGLKPFARLLRGELSNRLGLFGQAQMEIEQAEKLTPAPPVAAVLEAKVTALDGRLLFEEARKSVEAAKVAGPLKRQMRVRILLARRREKSPGRDRKEIDDEAFREAEPFRGATSLEGRRALMELARTIDEPALDAPPAWWDLLAEGHLRLGDPVRAGRLDAKGADRAEAAGQVEKAATLRYKAGAYLFEAGKFSEADRRLTRVLEQPNIPRDLKARAGMLRTLARGRGLATRDPESSRASYLSALESQVRDFPDEPSTGEARWLLGQVRLAGGRLDEALALWAAIPHGHPRWTEARAQIADRLREAVEAQRINRDSTAVASKMEDARKSLKAALAQADEGPEIVTLTLQQARLELTPDAGRPSMALEACDRLLKLAARPDQHQTARLYRMVALAQGGRSIEAEQAAKVEARSDDLARLLPALRLLDRTACEVEGEVSRRRLGLIARSLTTRLIDNLDQLPQALRDEAHLHHARALLFSGDAAAARKEIASWGGPVGEVDDELLWELADTYQRLDAFVLAIDAERYRGSRLSPGSLPWFESRYGMALAYYRADRPKDARQLIDATAILHPDLGGGELRARFERLRQKIGKD